MATQWYTITTAKSILYVPVYLRKIGLVTLFIETGLWLENI